MQRAKVQLASYVAHGTDCSRSTAIVLGYTNVVIWAGERQRRRLGYAVLFSRCQNSDSPAIYGNCGLSLYAT